MFARESRRALRFRIMAGNAIAPLLSSAQASMLKYPRLRWFADLRHALFLVCLLPLLHILTDIATNSLGSNAIQALHIRLGDWSLRFICITLAITPIQKITQWRGMANYRQLFGLYGFFYASLHLLGYLTVDHALAWRIVFIDVLESTYIWFGIFAYTVILLLAVTSPKRVKKRLGKAWKKLHRFIYPASIAAVVHYFWQLKGNLNEAFFYASVVTLLLMFRMLVWFKNRQLARLMIPRRHPVADD
jgi:methionine sulfoxide reductase heme-binding subunit